MNHQKVQKLCYFGEKLNVRVFQSLMMEENAISSKKKPNKQTKTNKQKQRIYCFGGSGVNNSYSNLFCDAGLIGLYKMKESL